ncbi:MAG: sugar nucleotide-binding protein [bacterium]
MKILMFGGRGQLGSAYERYFKTHGISVEITRVEIRDLVAVTKAITSTKPDVVLNLAARANIDFCEENKLTAFDSNTVGADTVGAACQKTNTYLVHMSTGCIQESLTESQAHPETDPATPLCFYSWTKLWAEQMLQHRASRHGLRVLLLRPRQLLSSELSPRNALTKMLSYNKFIDTPNSCTVVDDLLWVTEELIKRSAVGVYNVANPGVTSPYKIAEVLKEVIRPEMKFTKITKEELNGMTKSERIDAVLDCTKLNSLGIKLEPLEKRLREVCQDLRDKINSSEGIDLMKKVNEETAWKLGLKK